MTTKLKTINFKNKSNITLDGVHYQGYTIGKLPKKFAFIWDDIDEVDGISTWFNYRGLTYIVKDISKKYER
tara:strand:- start:394 stop:606 length:213 start_codon:yes stop_codon:yes gene_type:complete